MIELSNFVETFFVLLWWKTVPVVEPPMLVLKIIGKYYYCTKFTVLTSSNWTPIFVKTISVNFTEIVWSHSVKLWYKYTSTICISLKIITLVNLLSYFQLFQCQQW
jgi:hypothetical protein